MDELRHKRNEVSERTGELKQAGEDEKAEDTIERTEDLKSEIVDIEERTETWKPS